MLNTICMVGRLTANPQYTATQSGTSCARFTIACQRDFASNGGQKETDFIPCVSWKQTAEFITRHFNQGGMICVVGRLQINKWEKDGVKHSAPEILVNNAYFYGSAEKQNASASYAPAPSADDYPGAYVPIVDDDPDLPY